MDQTYDIVMPKLDVHCIKNNRLMMINWLDNKMKRDDLNPKNFTVLWGGWQQNLCEDSYIVGLLLQI